MSKKQLKHGWKSYARGLCKCVTCRNGHAKYERERRVRQRKKEQIEVEERAEKRGLNPNNKVTPRFRLEMMHDTFTMQTLKKWREEEYERSKESKS
tara:strand:- start:11154 stop:11441 length:288 start_codon:yes stop_codon:yes gene_type:complete